MTSAIGVDGTREPRFLFHCPCGKDIVTNRKKVTCACCGKTMDVKLVRMRRLRHNPKPRPLLCTGLTVPRQWHRHTNSEYHQLFCSMATAHSRRHRLESPDRHEHYRCLGLLILLAPIWVPLLWMFLCPVRDQDRPYHYERHDIHVRDSRGGGHTIPRWTRVND
jgi:hypothetical protein